MIKLKKIINDILENFSKSLLVIVGIFFGIFGFGLILDSFSVIKNEVNQSYMDTNPANLSIWVNNVDNELLDIIRNTDGVEDTETRRMIRSRVKVGDEWVTTLLYVVDDFSDVRINTFLVEKGEISAIQEGEILIERMALNIAEVDIGDNILVKIPLYNGKELKVIGSVYDAGQKPAWLEECVYGYISKETFSMLGDSSDFIQVLVSVTENKDNVDYIRTVLENIKQNCVTHGYLINRVEILESGESPNGAQINALLYLFEAFGILTLFLSAILVINLVSSLLSSQIKQIGIMKAVGANTITVSAMYYAVIVILGLIALVLALPAAAVTSRTIVNLCSDVLNFNVSSYSIPAKTYILQGCIGIMVPLIAASFPIYKGCKISVSDALRYSEVTNNSKNKVEKDKKVKKGSMVLRNLCRKWKRTVLTVLTLAVGGSIFLVAFDLNKSLDETIVEAEASLHYDSLFILSKDYDLTEIETILNKMNNIEKYEIYSGAMASMIYSDNTQSNSFQFVALDKDAQALDFPMIEGQWLSGENSNEIVVNNSFLDDFPDCQVGDEIAILSNRVTEKWRIVGIAKEVGGDSMAYANKEYYTTAYNKQGTGREIAFYYQDKSVASNHSITNELEKYLADNNLDVQSERTILDVESVLANHLKLIASFLIISSILIILVGIIGLCSTISIAILERYREIGVMRAMGASQFTITKMFIEENIILVLISFVLSFIISLPIANYLCSEFGEVFLQVRLNNCLSHVGLCIWLFSSIIIAIGVSTVLCKNALNKSIYENIN